MNTPETVGRRFALIRYAVHSRRKTNDVWHGLPDYINLKDAKAEFKKRLKGTMEGCFDIPGGGASIIDPIPGEHRIVKYVIDCEVLAVGESGTK